MKFLRKALDKAEPVFSKEGKLHKFHALYEMVDTFLFTPSETTKSASHIRDGIDLKRVMTIVVVAVLPAFSVAIYNTGLQGNLALQSTGAYGDGWRSVFIHFLGAGSNPHSVVDNVLLGLAYLIPVYVVTFAAGGFWEMLFAVVRKGEINEGFLVTGMLFPLILPATIPLWQVAIGISFGVVLGKEVFGGTGMNVFNPALVGRAFLFFAYPAQMSGNSVWVPYDMLSSATGAIETFTMTTPLAVVAEKGLSAIGITWWDAFWGWIPGSAGETSTFAILIGAVILLISGIASWRIMFSISASMVVFASILNYIGSDTNPMYSLTPAWHFVLGGFAFGTVFMATDPVSASMTSGGKYIYGAIIGFMVVLVRVINPAFPEGMMLSILFGNALAPLIDNVIMKRNIKRRKLRYVK